MKKDRDTVREPGYDAFISYRHLPGDAKLAARLQTLLESYRLPGSGKRLRVFRDDTELSASSDLGGGIRDALLRSRYLIAICSEKTRESRWCMEEIRQFKEARQGSVEDILIVLTSGEPEESIPEPLRTEGERGPLEPLYVDVRGQTLRQSLRTLKSEYYKLAAALLGCGLDDLLQRNHRRRRRQAAAVTAGALTLLSGVLVVVSVFAYRTWVSEQRYRTMLADNFTQDGLRQAGAGNPQEALADYVRALTLEPEQPAARTGAALLLQERLWPVWKEEVPGRLRNGRLLPLPLAEAGDPDTGYYFYSTLDQGFVVNEAGERVAELGPERRDLLGSASGWWTFLGEDTLNFYQPETGQERSLPRPTACSAGCDLENAELIGCVPQALALPGGRVIAAYLGMVYLYTFDEQGRAVETVRADLADAFQVEAAYKGLSGTNEIYLSPDASLALVTSGARTALYDTTVLGLKSVTEKYRYGLTGADISPGGGYFVLSYGNPYRIDLMNPGGLFEVYGKDGTCLFSSPASGKEALLGTAFCPDNEDCLLVWSAGAVHVWNWREGREIAAPIRRDDVSAACFGEDGTVLVECGRQRAAAYTLHGLSRDSGPEMREEWAVPNVLGQYYMDAAGPDGMEVRVTSSALTLFSADGEALDTVDLPAMGQRAALSPDFRTVFLYNNNVPALMAVPVDFGSGKLGEVRQLDSGGESVLSLWCGDGWLAVEAASRKLLVFDGKGERTGGIVPEHNGNISKVLSDGESGHIVLVMETAWGEEDSFHFERSGIVEIWDIPSGRLLESFVKEGKKIEAAGFSEDGLLVWSVDGETCVRQLAFPAPDGEALAFLGSLGCLALDGNQELVPQTPADSGFRMGNWSSLGRWEAARFSREEEPEAAPAFAELADAGDVGSEAWFLRCDALWRSLLAGDGQPGVQELDRFYGLYRNAAESGRAPERLKTGLEAYITLYERMDWGSGETISFFDQRMMETLADTDLYDGMIVQALRAAVAPSASQADGGTADGDILLAYSSHYLEMLADAFSGRGHEAALSMAEFCAENSMLEPYKALPLALARLYEGDARAAAEAVNTWIADCAAWLQDDDGLWLEQVKNELLWYEALAWRGEIDPAVFDEYLLQLDAYVALRVSELEPRAQEAGLALDDRIVGVNGQRIASRQHYRRLLRAEDLRTIEVVREGAWLSLEMSAAPAGFGAYTVIERRTA
mgnify:CR=1 FL=1